MKKHTLYKTTVIIFPFFSPDPRVAKLSPVLLLRLVKMMQITL